MNKLIKGSIAGAAGIALLLGGAGTLALWNDDADISNAAISAGNLSLAAGTGAWDTNPTNWVPGDSFTYTDTLTVVATGDKIKATLSVDKASITGDALLASVLKVDFAITGTLPDGVRIGDAVGEYEITAADPAAVNTYDLPVTVTVTFNSLSDNTTQDQDVDLANLGFKLVQHP